MDMEGLYKFCVEGDPKVTLSGVPEAAVRVVNKAGLDVTLSKETVVKLDHTAGSVVKEITPERALQLLVNAMPKKRRSRKAKAEAV